jgi:asparagine synthase (glutamine-hydrolysing)
MQRFVAFIAKSQDPSIVDRFSHLIARLMQRDDGWRIVFEDVGICVASRDVPHDGLTSYALPNARGVVFGRLFRRGSSDQPSAGSLAQDSALIVSSGGRRLLDSYWGAYVAFLSDPESRAKFIVRDVSGKMPCYIANVDQLVIAFSDVVDLLQIIDVPLTIDWQYIAAFIFFDQLRIRRTPLHNVSELLAGDRITISDAGVSQDALWSPARICADEVVRDFNQAADELKASTHICVDAWANAFSKVAISLSGGFDSAVLLGSTQRVRVGRPEVICINRYLERAGEDERKYARIVAAHFGKQLTEENWSAAGTELGSWIESAHVSVKPTIAELINLLDVGFLSDWADTLGVQSIWTGQGGDHLFFHQRTSLIVSDYLSLNRLGRDLLTTIVDATRLDRESFWGVLKAARTTLRDRIPWSEEIYSDLKPIFVNPDALPHDVIAYISHPWAASLSELPKGKQMQVLSVADLVNRHLPLRGVERIEHHHPLISQPLIETCFRIPTYLLLRGGRPRALARHAFADRVPAEILARESKGSSTSHVMNRVRNGRKYLRELLLDGALVQHDVVDRRTIEKFLGNDAPIRPEQLFPLLAAISAEIWIRQWQPRAIAAAA